MTQIKQPQHKIVNIIWSQHRYYPWNKNMCSTKLQALNELGLFESTLMELNNFIHSIISHPSPSSTRIGFLHQEKPRTCTRKKL